MRQESFRSVQNPGEEIEVFVILVLSAPSITQLLLRRDEFNTLDPLDHLVATPGSLGAGAGERRILPEVVAHSSARPTIDATALRGHYRDSDSP